MPNLRDRPIRQKITLVTVVITGIVLLPAFTALFCFQAYNLKKHSAHELAVVGEIMAHNSSAAVMFKDEDAAVQILSGLKTMPQIVSGMIQLTGQQNLAFFGTTRDKAEMRTARLQSGFRINGDRILLAQPVMVSGKREATLYVLADLHKMTSQLLKLYGGIFGLVLGASLFVTFILSSQFLRFITDPIFRLADTARTIADHNDYSVRAKKVCADELGFLTDAFNQMLAQIQSQDTALRKAEEKYRLIFEDAIEGMFQTTPEGRCLSANPALARMYGYESPQEFMAVSDIGETIYVDRERRNEFKRIIEAQGFVQLFECEVYRKDRSKIWVCANARAVRDATGAIAYYEGTVEDITQRKRVAEVERANKAKSEFLSRVSHELRTPLNAILGFGQLLERQNPTETQRDRIHHILNAGKHLLELINEVLDISRIESGRMQLSLEPVGVATALTEALDLMRPLAAERTVQLLMPASGFDKSVFVLADGQRFKQVLLNLLTNAVKYTPASGTVSVSFDTNGEKNVRILVHDTGPGIPNEKLERLFRPFERLGAEQSKVEGTGLGLALSQRLMQVMGGSIGVETTDGKGSVFWLELPQTESPLQKYSVQQKSSDGGGARSETTNRKILYIEDNPSNLALITQILEERPEVKLLTATQGKTGLGLARLHSPDLILLDVHLPDLEGREVVSLLKLSETTRDIPIVVVSADATTSQIDRLVTAGADAYLTKPLDVVQFFRILDKAAVARDAKRSATAACSNEQAKFDYEQLTSLA